MTRAVTLMRDQQQYGEQRDGHPWGITALGADLVSLQQYDVSISLKLPRTPENLAAGNFMLDLALLSPPQSSMMGANTSTSLIAHSRRPAILTYTSPLMDTAHTLARMPLYLIGWQREAETLHVPMFENIEFARGWRNVPGSLRLEIQSREQMQVYDVEVRFLAKFSGLRWLMYRWRLLSFFTFTSMFWSVSMITSTIVWLLLSQYWGSRVEGDRRMKSEKTEDGDTPIKEEYDEASIKNEDDAARQEEIEQTTNIAPLNNETEEAESIRAIRYDSDSGRGTAFDGYNILGAQRRRSHMSDLPES
ncbi:hypothetical protein UA08_01603 [Talaromyces atroroseus]|uniref:Seipin n=1 Tax=Talaromyces atroroseus TaxID=1441469 RepID=A0A1Q5QB43_TALAT|nr:hypothetical protein UA08_01603 [Talaromyces atroroseus]OKL63140.1 hypothetical protein UA08_01603 [Talaromyces atroroseus]